MADLDGDGDLDMMVGQYDEGDFNYFENTSPIASVASAAAAEQPEIYPNPVVDVLTIDLDGIERQGSVGIELRDLSGRILRKMEGKAGVVAEIEVGDLPAGTFILSVFTGEEVWVKRVVKW